MGGDFGLWGWRGGSGGWDCGLRGMAGGVCRAGWRDGRGRRGVVFSGEDLIGSNSP